MPDPTSIPIHPPGNPRLADLRAHAEALGLRLVVHLETTTATEPDQPDFGFVSSAILPASELSEDR